jgi:hypothetical protein
VSSLIYSDRVEIQSIYEGDLCIMPAYPISEDLCKHAENIVTDFFERPIDEIETDVGTDISLFITKAHKCKSTFTNSDKTQKLLKALIAERYKRYPNRELFYDVPRLRIVPNSNFLSSGISYNYKPHRDTWYGAAQDQVNHWMAVSNVTKNSTFYVAPSYFGKPIHNNSEIFNLDEWDSKYRTLAAQSVENEQRPHPIPLVELAEEDKLHVVIPKGSEIVFSGSHLHGSQANTTSKVRFSIDYRVSPETLSFKLPQNIDSRATGDYKKYMLNAR